MGLSQALATSTAGLRTVQAGLALIALTCVVMTIFSAIWLHQKAERARDEFLQEMEQKLKMD